MGSFAQGALIEQKTDVTNSGGTTNLTVTSTAVMRFTGSAAQTVVLPDATTLVAGRYFIIENESNSLLTINFYGGTLAAYVASGTQRKFQLHSGAVSAGDWVVGNQVDNDGPLAIRATRPTPNSLITIVGNQVYGGVGSTLSTAPIDDVINTLVTTTIDFSVITATGGIVGGSVLTQDGTFTRPVIASGQYVRLIFSYISILNAINTNWSTAAASQGALANAGLLFAAIDGTPVGYVDLISLGSYQFKTVGSSGSSPLIENKSITKFAAGTGAGTSGDKSFRFQNIVGSILTVKAGSLILNDGRELYLPADISIDLSTVASIDGNYYGYLDSTAITTAPTYFNGRKLYQVVASNFMFSTNTPDNVLVNLSRFVPIGTVQRVSGNWLNQQSTALRRHDNVVAGTDASLEYSFPYTTIGTVGSVGQMSAGHVLDSLSFPSSIASANISWYGLNSVSDSSTNGRNLTGVGSPAFTGINIVGLATTFAPNGTTSYLSSTSSFFAPSAATNFAFGIWIKANNYASASIQTIISNWGTGSFSYKLRLNNGVLEFVTSPDGTTSVATTLYTSTLSGWNQLVVTYTASGTLFNFYLNNTFLLSASLTMYSNTSTLNIAAENNGSNLFAGVMDEFFFVNGGIIDQDSVSRLNATKIVHNRNLSTTSQKWSAMITDGNVERDLSNFVIHVTTNYLYADFSTQLITAQLALRLHNIGSMGLSKPVKSRTLRLTAAHLDTLMPITHNLYDIPTLKLQVDEGTNQFLTHNDASYFISTPTQITSTGTTLSSIVGSDTNVRFTYAVGGESVNSRTTGRFIIVGDSTIPDADYPDLWSALAASATISGSRILVMTTQYLTTSTVITNTGVYIEFIPSASIISTVSSGVALTVSGSVFVYNMKIDFQNNADGLSITGNSSWFNNLYIKISGAVTNAVTFGASSARNSVYGSLEITGSLITIVNDLRSSGTPRLNTYSITSLPLFWNTIYKSSSFNLTSGMEAFTNSSLGSFTATLPANPVLGDRVRLLDESASWAAFNIVVARNGKTIGGSASDLSLNVNNNWVELVYDGISNWKVITS